MSKWQAYIDKWKHRIRESGVIDYAVRTAQSIKVSKQADISLYDALGQYNTSLRSTDILTQSKAVAYNFTLALFPAIIFMFTLIPYIPVVELSTEDIMAFFKEAMPDSMYDVTSSTISDILSKQRGGLLSFGFFMALILATNGMYGLIDAFNKCYKTSDTRNIIMKRVIAVLLTFVLVLVIVSAVFFLIIGNVLIDFVFEYTKILSDYSYILVRLVQYGIFTLIFLLGISSIYYIAPAVHKRWRFFSVGSVVGAILCMIISAGFSFYLNNFATYNKVYGAIGTLIGIMLWLQMMSWVLLVGFQVNASIDAAKNHNLREQDLLDNNV